MQHEFEDDGDDSRLVLILEPDPCDTNDDHLRADSDDYFERWYAHNKGGWKGHDDQVHEAALRAWWTCSHYTDMALFYDNTLRWPTVQEAAKMLGVKPDTVTDYIKDGVLKSNGRPGKGKRRVDPASIDAHRGVSRPFARCRAIVDCSKG